MTKEKISINIADVSGFAKALKSEIGEHLSHVEILNLIAKSSGHKNYQHLKALQTNEAAKPQEASDEALNKIRKYFDNNLLMIKWPNKESLRILCLWFIWSRLPNDVEFTEIALNRLLNGLHSFNDAAKIRRYLIENGFMTRSRDCKDYKKVSLNVPSEYLCIINLKAK